MVTNQREKYKRQKDISGSVTIFTNKLFLSFISRFWGRYLKNIEINKGSMFKVIIYIIRRSASHRIAAVKKINALRLIRKVSAL